LPIEARSNIGARPAMVTGGIIARNERPRSNQMPTRIVFAAPGVKGGVLTQVFVEEPEHVFESFTASERVPFKLTARTSREEAVYVNPSLIAYWTAYTPSRARTGEQHHEQHEQHPEHHEQHDHD
jgi:hypothetical protein